MEQTRVAPRKWQGMNWIRPERRLAIYLRDEFTCTYCGCDLHHAAAGETTLDHLVPHINGGKNTTDNLVTACRTCNSSRQDKPVFEWADEGALIRVAIRIKRPIDVTAAKAILKG